MRRFPLALVAMLALSCVSWSGGSAPVHAATATAAATAAADPLQRAFVLYAGKGRAAPSLKAWEELTRLQAGVADADTGKAVAQMRAMMAAEMGRYDEALAIFPFRAAKPVAPGPAPSATMRPVDAAAAITRLARDRRVVIVNEAHHLPQTRLLLVQLLPRLRAMGFTDYAAETLDKHVGAGIVRRGYAVRGDGVYAREPVFGQLLAEAARLGYRLDSYEDAGGDDIQSRETGQAEHLAELLRRHPDARLIVHVGYAHVREARLPERMPMAAELKRLTGLDPLTVDQTTLLPWRQADDGDALRRAVDRRLPPGDGPFVFLAGDGTPWSAEPGQYDVSVAIPAAGTKHGRPAWLWDVSLQRRPFTGYGALCHGQVPCQVVAQRAGATADAVPADVVTVADLAALPALALPPGRYRLTATDADDRVLGTRTLAVAASPPR